jgi:HD-GYP domain-containing protein (c-di-GMP phosphodiesterase class II)
MQYHLPPFSNLSGSISKQFKHLASALTDAIGRKDRCTAAHVERTAYYAVRIARAFKDLPGIPRLGEGLIERVWWAAALHDVGKIEIEDAILKKASALEPEERRSMREHPRLGLELLGKVAEVREVADAALYHHERWDGQGYPCGLKGVEIPWIARLIAVADAYDAMISTRPYRPGMSPAAAYDEILSLSGSQFDPLMIQAFSRAFGHSICHEIGQA